MAVSSLSGKKSLKNSNDHPPGLPLRFLTAQSPLRRTCLLTSQSAALANAGWVVCKPDSARAITVIAVSQTGDTQDCRRNSLLVSMPKRSMASIPLTLAGDILMVEDPLFGSSDGRSSHRGNRPTFENLQGAVGEDEEIAPAHQLL